MEAFDGCCGPFLWICDVHVSWFDVENEPNGYWWIMWKAQRGSLRALLWRERPWPYSLLKLFTFWYEGCYITKISFAKTLQRPRMHHFNSKQYPLVISPLHAPSLEWSYTLLMTSCLSKVQESAHSSQSKSSLDTRPFRTSSDGTCMQALQHYTKHWSKSNGKLNGNNETPQHQKHSIGPLEALVRVSALTTST